MRLACLRRYKEVGANHQLNQPYKYGLFLYHPGSLLQSGFSESDAEIFTIVYQDDGSDIVSPY